MEVEDEIIENDDYAENDTQRLNSEGEEEEQNYEPNYSPRKRRKRSHSDHEGRYRDENTSDQYGEDNNIIDHDYRHAKGQYSGGDNSGGESDHRHHSRHQSDERDRDRNRDGHRRKRHRSHRKDRERSRHSRKSDSRSSQEIEADLEDGELEDGEIDDEDGREEDRENITPTKTSHGRSEKRGSSEKSSLKKYQRESSGHLDSQEYDQEDYHEREFPEGSEEEKEEEGNHTREEKSKSHRSNQDEKKRRKERRDKEKRRKQHKEDKKKKKHREYHDYDKMEDEYEQNWTTDGGRHTDKPMESRGSRGSHERSPPVAYGDQYDDDDDGQYERGYKGHPGPYDSPYNSPPGPYDSPSYDEDSDGEMYDGNQRQSMMSLVEGEYIDANVVIDEGENIYKRPSSKKLKSMKHMKRKMERQQSDQPQKKKPLLLTPMNERPICKFFKEGKCSKGNECPFNHDYRPPKKLDLCKFYLNSQCSKGDNCIFMHGEYPCKFFHTGAKCYSGDNCKFSHAPLTDETAPLVDKFYQEFHGEEDGGFPDGGGQRMGQPRPSLLGSPPRHIMEQMDRVKKIPSIFDIQVFPPGQSPKKPPMPDGPPNRHPPPQMCSPPSRPSGFYTDLNQPPQQMQGPPMQGPQMQGPQQGPRMQGPPMQGPPMQGPPMQGQGMQGPPMQGQGMQGQQIQGQRMQGPQMQGPPMTGPKLMGPGPNPQTSSATMNPAVALVGALLRQAAPQVLCNKMGPSGPQNVGQQGPQNMGPGGPPGPGQKVPQQFQGSGSYGPGNFVPPKNNMMSPSNDQQSSYSDQNNHEVIADQTSTGSLDRGQESQDTESLVKSEPGQMKTEAETERLASEIKSNEDESNEKKLATLGLNLDTLTHLPAKQRELFLRIQNQQAQASDGEDGQTNEEEKGDKEESQQEEKMDDDNWYSSDDEESETPKPKLTDILKNLSQKPTPESPQTPVPMTTPSSQSSTLDIMQMINSIRTQAGTAVSTPEVPSNSNPPSFPKDPVVSLTNQVPKAPVNVPAPVIINSSEGDIPYKLRPLHVDKSQHNQPPQGMDVYDPQFKNDPRVKKFIDYLESVVQKTSKVARNTDPRLPSGPNLGTEVSSKVDPRTGQPVGQADRPIDPRIKRQNDPRVDMTMEMPRPSDPRLQRSVSENPGIRPNVPPHMQRGPSNSNMGINNLPIRPMNANIMQRQESGPPKQFDPRLARQLSRDSNNIQNTPPNVDPRMNRQISGPSFSSGPGSDTTSRPIDPRMGPQDPRSGQIDPRMGPLDPRMGFQDPRMDPRVNNQDPRKGLQDPRMGPDIDSQRSNDPRTIQRQGSIGSDPRKLPTQDPRRPPSEMGSVQSGSDSEIRKGDSQDSDSVKPKLDYRNDPRFKRKPASESVLAHKRYTGQRKGSMEYSSPLGLDSTDKPEGASGYNSYNRPLPDIAKINTKTDPRTHKGKGDRTNRNEGVGSPNINSSPLPPPLAEAELGLTLPPPPELPPFIPPPTDALEPQMKDFFKTMDPTASPFC